MMEICCTEMEEIMDKLKETAMELRESAKELWSGEVTITKRECFLIGAVLVLSGILLGILLAPAKNGFSWNLFSHNGNNSGNNNGNNDSSEYSDNRH